jgi:hypothetical protein
LFADKLYEARTYLEFNRREVEKDALLRVKKFHGETSVARKLRLIADEFAIDTPLRVHMAGLSKARNALSHNLGFVGPRHCTEDDRLDLSWMGAEMIVEGRAVGETFEPIQVEAGDQIALKLMVTRRRTFSIGAAIDLSPHDLSEICLTYFVQAQNLIKEFEKQLAERTASSPQS